MAIFLYLLQSSSLKVQVGFLPLRKMIVKVKVWTVLFMSAYLTACAAPGTEKYQTIMDSVTAEKVNQIIRSDVIPSSGENHGDVISRVSSAFLGTPYQADTLIGGPGTPEALVVNFNGVDCFTLADYVEALTRSHDQKSFLHNLTEVRYTGGTLTTSAAGTSSPTGSPPHHAMPGMSHRISALTMPWRTNSLTVNRTGGVHPGAGHSSP